MSKVRLELLRINGEYSIDHLSTYTTSVEFSVDIVKACVLLHNIVRKQDGYNYEGTFIRPDLLPFVNNEEYRVGRSVHSVRDKFADYFISPEGELQWQYTI